VTDDPVPTDYRNWEIYTGIQYRNQCCGVVSADAPFAEFNYGAMPNVQVSIAFPMELDELGTQQRYGYGVTEFGIKTRFVQESENRPQISFYPSIQIPSQPGGHVETFLPLWLQKSSGPWTAFGGGGTYLNPGPGQRNSTFLGAALERALSSATAIGFETYHQGATVAGGPSITAANAGVVALIGDHHAIVFSLGRAFTGAATFAAYGAYEFELGPARAK
jgi:hypothetical protein